MFAFAMLLIFSLSLLQKATGQQMHSSFYLFALSYILLQYSKSCVICFCQCNKKLPGGVDTPLLVAITAPSLKCQAPGGGIVPAVFIFVVYLES